MSRYTVEAKEADKYTVVIGWDKPLQTFFAQVIRKDSDRDFDAALWKGTNPREIGSVAELQQALKDYADIPKEMQNALRFDMGPDDSFDTLSSRDKQAIASYEASSTQSGEVPTNEGRMQWAREWQELDEEHRLAGVEAEWERNHPPPDKFDVWVFHYNMATHHPQGWFGLPVPMIQNQNDYHRGAIVTVEYDPDRPVVEILEEVFARTQGGQDEGVEWNEPSRSTSVGDVILTRGYYHRCESEGWSRLENSVWQEFSDRFKPAERDVDNDMGR